jgi:hypothetical protein
VNKESSDDRSLSPVDEIGNEQCGDLHIVYRDGDVECATQSDAELASIRVSKGR